MRLLVRYLLWILIAAIPLQGGAAAFMSCSGNVLGQTPVATLPATPADAAEMATAPDEHCEKVPDHQDKKPHSKCSACASCCVGAAAPPSVSIHPIPRPLVNFSHVSPEPAIIAFVPATLERPPRQNS